MQGDKVTTDEQILELVATGKFTLPAGLTWVKLPKSDHPHYQPYWRFGAVSIDKPVAHDLCAMHFAREAIKPDREPDGFIAMSLPLCHGDSAAAIAALYAALKP
jgi:hypothetical protein